MIIVDTRETLNDLACLETSQTNSTFLIQLIFIIISEDWQLVTLGESEALRSSRTVLLELVKHAFKIHISYILWIDMSPPKQITIVLGDTPQRTEYALDLTDLFPYDTQLFRWKGRVPLLNTCHEYFHVLIPIPNVTITYLLIVPIYVHNTFILIIIIIIMNVNVWTRHRQLVIYLE